MNRIRLRLAEGEQGKNNKMSSSGHGRNLIIILVMLSRPGGGGYSCVGTNRYVRLTVISFSAFYEREGCTKMGTPEQEGSYPAEKSS